MQALQKSLPVGVNMDCGKLLDLIWKRSSASWLLPTLEQMQVEIFDLKKAMFYNYKLSYMDIVAWL